MGRKLRSYEQIDGGTEVLLAEQRYNEIGELKEKGLGKGLQNTAYAYNERGWLKSSNSNEFSLQLKYQDGDLPQFNGNISGQLWGNSANTDKSFSYSYDKINRLLNGSGTGMREAISYDVMGNITSLNRDGQNRYYVYNGNQLLRTTGLATLADYQYDPNGNATVDGRTGKAFTYNTLNLPETATGGLSYVYDSSGRKIKKKSSGSTTDYIDGIQYTNGAIELIQTEVGIARRNGASYSYEYNLSDHLGNNRVTFYKNPNGGLEVLQRDDYYAFGLRKSVTGSSTANKYLYNGKELQDELGQYDYGARFYDPAIGRFSTPDPLSEESRRFSPYVYGNNNPMRFIDPDGMFSTDVTQNDDGTYKVVGGDINDGDKSIYVVDAGGKRTGETIGESLTMESYYFSEDGTWRGTIDPNDNSGLNFFNNDIVGDKSLGIVDYMSNATAGGIMTLKGLVQKEVRMKIIMSTIFIEECLLDLKKMALKFMLLRGI